MAENAPGPHEKVPIILGCSGYIPFYMNGECSGSFCTQESRFLRHRPTPPEEAAVHPTTRARILRGDNGSRIGAISPLLRLHLRPHGLQSSQRARPPTKMHHSGPTSTRAATPKTIGDTVRLGRDHRWNSGWGALEARRAHTRRGPPAVTRTAIMQREKSWLRSTTRLISTQAGGGPAPQGLRGLLCPCG